MGHARRVTMTAMAMTALLSVVSSAQAASFTLTGSASTARVNHATALLSTAGSSWLAARGGSSALATLPLASATLLRHDRDDSLLAATGRQ